MLRRQESGREEPPRCFKKANRFSCYFAKAGEVETSSPPDGIPRSVVPELDNVVANLELLPVRMNQSKGDKIGQRQLDLARKLNEAGLLSQAEMKVVVQVR